MDLTQKTSFKIGQSRSHTRLFVSMFVQPKNLMFSRQKRPYNSFIKHPYVHKLIEQTVSRLVASEKYVSV